ncbi:MAG: M48 family metalloprotease [Planctomycetes bacterium]|nr:M48 family metalloprotease [Planctomycetota bacterium]
MLLPVSFLLGLLCLLGSSELAASLPHRAEAGTLVPYLALLPLPALLTLVLLCRVRRSEARSPGLTLVRWVAAPSVYLVLLEGGDLRTLAEQWAGSSMSLTTVILLAPLLLMEVLVWAAHRWSIRTWGGFDRMVPLHANGVVLLTVLVLGFVLGVDALQLHRGIQVFVLHTALGWMLAFLSLSALLGVFLPVLFRLVMPTSQLVPEDARFTARTLGFPPGNVRMLRSRYRLVNAAMVGLLAPFHCLFLTDGLLRVLDPLSIRGVVAHEVGHAKARHPLLLAVLFVFVPLLLYHPAEAVGATRMSDVTAAVVALPVVAVTVFVMRRVFHRFELEADQLSADALGGAMPCILALHKIGELFGSSKVRASFRHPSEEVRIDHLLRCDGDPAYRAEFMRRGRVLRRALSLFLLITVAVNLWAHARIWPVDRLLVAFYSGRFEEAERGLVALGDDVPADRAGVVAQLREEVAAARQILPHGGRWNDIREELARRALERGKRVLIEVGPREARPWFSLAVDRPCPTPLELSLYYYCRAEAARDGREAARMRDHLTRHFELGEELTRALAAARTR